jgi:hypothetical protein
MTPAMRAVTLALSFACGCGFDLLIVEVESREVCVGGLSAVFPEQAGGTVTATLVREDGSQPGELAADDAIDLPEGFELVEVAFVGAHLTPGDGIASFAFIEWLRVIMTGSHLGALLPPVELIDFDLAADGSSQSYVYSNRTGEKFIDSASPANLIDYFQADQLSLELTLAGAVPDHEWSLGLAPCFAVTAEYRQAL